MATDLLLTICRSVLIRSLAFVQMQLDFVASCGKTIKFQPRVKDEPSHYCATCEVDVRDLSDYSLSNLRTFVLFENCVSNHRWSLNMNINVVIVVYSTKRGIFCTCTRSAASGWSTACTVPDRWTQPCSSLSFSISTPSTNSQTRSTTAHSTLLV